MNKVYVRYEDQVYEITSRTYNKEQLEGMMIAISTCFDRRQSNIDESFPRFLYGSLPAFVNMEEYELPEFVVDKY